MAIPNLPSDIITDILSRLPSKTLIRFKPVSKQWYSVINSPSFINLHLTQTLISQNPLNLIVSQSSISSIVISDEDNPNFHLSELDHPLKHLCDTHDFPSYNHKFSPLILGSINGLVCISMYNKSSVVLYSPSTKTHRFVPHFTPSPETNPHFEISGFTKVNFVFFGFGFDSVSGDYKVLRIIDTRTNDVSVYYEASVYSLRNDLWKCVDDQTMMCKLTIHNGAGVLVNEVLHFLLFNGKFDAKVKCFNLRTEIFSIFNLPKLDEGYVKKTCVIKELGGCLSVMVNHRKMGLSTPGPNALAQADLWVMKEYGNEESWFRLFSISDPSRLGVLTYLRPVVYSRDEKRVLFELKAWSFGWYCWDSERFERITVHGWPSNYAPCETWTFVDSLVSFGNGKDKEKPKVVPKKNRNKILSSGFKLRL